MECDDLMVESRFLPSDASRRDANIIPVLICANPDKSASSACLNPATILPHFAKRGNADFWRLVSAQKNRPAEAKKTWVSIHPPLNNV